MGISKLVKYLNASMQRQLEGSGLKTMLSIYKRTQPNPCYIEQIQKDGFIPKYRNRTVLYMLEWKCFDCKILALAINILDRYLSQKSIAKSKIELTCLVCIKLASKLSDNKDMRLCVQDIITQLEHKVSHEDVYDCEIDINNSLNFRLYAVTGMDMMIKLADIYPFSSLKEKKATVSQAKTSLKFFQSLKILDGNRSLKPYGCISFSFL